MAEMTQKKYRERYHVDEQVHDEVVGKLRKENERLRAELKDAEIGLTQQYDEAREAEAERDTLREALRFIAGLDDCPPEEDRGRLFEAALRARAALGGCREAEADAQDMLGEPRERAQADRRLLERVSEEAWFVLSGGDDPHERCSECGCAGYGMLRDALHAIDARLGEQP